jgi:hypothetical protein
VKTEKPTGDAECPLYIDRAYEIEQAMNDKGGSRDLDDEEIADAILITSDDDDDNDRPPPLPRTKIVVKSEPGAVGPIARRTPADRLTTPATSRASRRGAGQDFLASVSSVLDPAAQAQRHEDRSSRAIQTSQIFTLTSQLRESQALVESLRNRLSESDRDRNNAERRADRVEMMSMLSSSRREREASPPRRRDRRQRQEVYYADGGRATCWVGGSDDDDIHLMSDSPGTRRYTQPYESPSSLREAARHISARASSPFHSAMSGLNNMLPDPPNHAVSSSSCTAIHVPNHNPLSSRTPQRSIPSSSQTIAVTVTPHSRREGVTLVISPRLGNSDQGESGKEN